MTAPLTAVRRISVSQACERMKKRLGISVTAQRVRQIVVDQVSLREDGIIKAVRIGRGGWWWIDAESFDRWLDQNYEE